MMLNRFFYLLKEGFKSIFTHGFMSFASVTVITACLIIMGSFSLLALNIDRIIGDLEAENQVVAYIDEDLNEEEAAALQDKILAVPNVREAVFISRDEAMQEFAEDYEEALFEDIDSSVFRNRFVVYLDDISRMGETQGDLRAVEGVAKVNAYLEYAQGFITVRNIVSAVSLVLIVILVVVSVFIMANTIKLASFSRREEIAIMKMVGAGNAFIRFPFVVEGMILGLLGGGLAFLVEWGMYQFVCDKILANVSLEILTAIPFGEIMYPLLAVYLACGFFVGTFGSAIAIRNYLKV